MNLLAISDLHIAYQTNRDALMSIRSQTDNWLILAGDIGESEAHLEFALSILSRKFKQIIWTPGNHDLWSSPQGNHRITGEGKYFRLVDICRKFGVLTPEYPYANFEYSNKNYLLVPLFILYDYSFRPEYISRENAVYWASESGIICNDEILLNPEPYDSVASWCARRCDYSENRLNHISLDRPIILINHFPLHPKFAFIKQYPRFSIWCGTRLTMHWHTHFNVKIVVYGHMHIRSKCYLDNVRFEEVSLGYPSNWIPQLGMENYLKSIF